MRYLKFTAGHLIPEVLGLLLLIALFIPGPARAELSYVSSTLWSDVRAVTVREDTLFGIFSNGLVLLELIPGEYPALIGQLYLEGNGHDL
ncbi:hypothetical protein KAU04_05955, partial [bacterium]|nr:hypothetical protein [bacterium]